MAMRSVDQVFPAGWSELAPAVQEMKDKLFGIVPEIPAVDFSGLRVPPAELAPILEKNLAAFHGNVSLKDYTADDSPYKTQAFFDDQLLEVLFSIQFRYTPPEFIGQLVWLVHQFLCEPAAFRASVVQSRIRGNEGEQCVSVVLTAMDQSKNPDERAILHELLMELTEGGEEPWMADVNEDLRTRVRTLAQTG